MGRWQDLGEVPDSDDESLDDFSSQPDGRFDNGTQTGIPEAPEVDDPWRIPSSPPSRFPLLPSNPESSPLSPPPPPEELDQLDNNDLSRPKSFPLERSAFETSPSEKPCGSQEESSILGDEISRPYVTITAPSSAQQPGSRLSVTHTSSPTPANLPAIFTIPSSPHGTTEEFDFAATQAGVFVERSLRPRKPIQEHPYLLENAQYAKFMKTHGIRPVRATVEPPVQKRRAEDDSQDQEFEANPSQEPMSTNAPADTTDESQPVLFDDPDDDRDLLALSPETPGPRSSSPADFARASSQQLRSDQTNDTSVTGDDFPSLYELVRRPARTKARELKRPYSSKSSSTRKRLKGRTTPPPPPSSPLPPRVSADHISEVPSLSPGPRGEIEQSRNVSLLSTPELPLPRRQREASLGAALPSYPSTPSPENRHPSPSRIVDLTGPDGDATSPEDEAEAEAEAEVEAEADSDSSSSDQDNGAELIRHVKRIRGVLPASWLRLDQNSGPEAARTARRPRNYRPSNDTPNQTQNPRRGVALTRQSRPGSSTTIPIFSDSDSDDYHDVNDHRNDHNGPETAAATPQKGTATQPTPLGLLFNDENDDVGSVVEEDHIDRMLSGTKRRSSSSATHSRNKRQKTFQRVTSQGPRKQRMRQPRITQALSQSHTAPSSHRAARADGTAQRSHRRPRLPRAKRQPRTARTPPPPLLSILDVVESEAPQFLRIAARTAKGNGNLGKSSPSRKHIELGTRGDNVDACSVLRDWRNGKIRPRIPTPAVRSGHQGQRPPLGERSANPTTPSVAQSRTASGRAGREENVTNDTVASGREENPRRKDQSSRVRWHDTPSTRPAQLEIDDNEQPERARFMAWKRYFDALFKRTDDKVGSERPLTSASFLDILQRQDEAAAREPDQPARRQPKRNDKSRFRKRSTPRQIDTTAPCFTYANDPLPQDDFTTPHIEEPEAAIPDDKLGGLGPYGTVYTQHFEIFPLDRGVFFHESTVIGRGCIQAVMDPAYHEKLQQPRPSASFEMDGQALRWGLWDGTISSEFGILVDWIGEQLLSGGGAVGIDQAMVSRQALNGADFVLRYILDSLYFPDAEAEKSFVGRAIEVFQGFTSRIGESSPLTGGEQTGKLQAEVLARFVVALSAIHQLHQLSGLDNFSMAIQIEELLTKVAKQTIKRLLKMGLDDLRSLYGDLQRLSGRERGIREDHTVANSWIILMRVLENAHIPRASFWDITQAAMMDSQATSGNSAQVFEELWRSMFTLLPLCEFDDSGVLLTGRRHVAPVEGWALPQRLLKRVFQLYSANPRQGPSFNEYCRALAARCHFLVQQWGWYKCSGIIGTIFDFFGSQDLGHLRNEEVYESPRFLENLHRNPSLDIEPQDRCFHIFIKLLGLVIQRLKKLDLTKDIRNLKARTLPNHNRQYLKENTVRQHELSALRNHHDLLCTLFWAAPPALRPAVHLIEKLVVPGSSHKEACLINLRAWSQLARYVVSSNEGHSAFRPFISWQTSIFQQLLDQYLSAAPDIQRQLRELPKHGSGVSSEVVDSMIRRNKAAAMDVMYLSVKASLDVLKLAGSLSAATGTLNIPQLQLVFTRLDWRSPNFDWSVVLVAVETLEYYVAKIEQAAEVQYSSDSENLTDPQELEEAVLLLDHRLVEPFFSMTRSLLELPDTASRGPSDRIRCLEKAITLSARMASRFIHSGFTRTENYFTSKKYGVFGHLPVNLNSPGRTYLPLFLATLVQNHVFDFREVGLNLLGLWMMLLVKPAYALSYETYLAGILKQKNIPYLQRTVVPAGIAPDYNQNREFIAAGLSYMREDLLQAEGPVVRRQRKEGHSRCLQAAMNKMKDDLKTLKAANPAEHKAYMAFVQQIVALIESHGVGICAVDSFFTQPSSDYSPPAQDPQLHAARIIGYGIRLGEGEPNAIPQLFYYLYNNFKIALAHDKLHDERTILQNAMSNRHVLSFTLARALPGIIWATSKENSTWPLLDVYLGALRTVLTRSCLPKELNGEDGIDDVSALLKSVLAGLRALQASNGLFLSPTQLYILVRLTEMASLLQPSLTSYMLSQSQLQQQLQAQQARQQYTAVEEIVLSFQRFVDVASAYLAKIPPVVAVTGLPEIEPLLAGLEDGNEGALLVFGSGRELDPKVDEFANFVADDVSKNWAVSESYISWNTPGRVPGVPPSQSGPGTRYEFPSNVDLVREMRCLLSSWVLGRGRSEDGADGRSRRSRRARVRIADRLIF